MIAWYSNISNLRIQLLRTQCMVRIRYKPHSTLQHPKNSKIRAIVENAAPLRNEDKPPFLSYWNFIAHLKYDPSQTILHNLPIDSVVQFTKLNRLKSSTARGFYRREMLFNSKVDFEKINELIKKLDLSKEPLSSHEELLTLCIRDSIQTNDIVIAADLYILYYTLHPEKPLRNDLCQLIVSALAFENPRYDHIHLVKYLDLDNLFNRKNSKLPLTQTQIVTLCNKALSLEDSPILTKQTLNRIMDIEITPNEDFRNEKMIAAYHLIERDYAANNAAGVLLTWTNIKNYYTSITKHDPRIIHKIIKIFTHHKAYRNPCKEVIDQLPPEYYSNNPLILPTIIDYATKVGNLPLAKEFMSNVNKYLQPPNTQVVLFSKRCLSSLLRMHLRFKDSKGVDRVLKQILEIFGKHSEENLSAVVSHLVAIKSVQNLEKAIRLVDTLPKKRALLSYASIINKIIEWQIASDSRFDKTSMPIIDNLLRKAHTQDPHRESSLWNILASLFIKKLVHYRNFQRKESHAIQNTKKRRLNTTNLDLAKLIYIKSNNHKEDPGVSDINPFKKSSPHRVILKITKGNRFVILRNIALNSIKGRRRDIFLWCCSELYQEGMPVKELLLEWNVILNHEIRRAQFTDKRQIEDKLSIKGLPFINEMLK